MITFLSHSGIRSYIFSTVKSQVIAIKYTHHTSFSQWYQIVQLFHSEITGGRYKVHPSHLEITLLSHSGIRSYIFSTVK